MVAKKWMTVSVAAALTMVVGVSVVAFAGSLTKQEQYEALKAKFESQKAALDTLPPEQNISQGYEVKALSLQVGQLEKELYPNPAKELEQLIFVSKASLTDLAIHYRSKAKSGPEAAKIVESITAKLEKIQQIEKAYKENSRPVEELLAEIEAMLKSR